MNYVGSVLLVLPCIPFIRWTHANAQRPESGAARCEEGRCTATAAVQAPHSNPVHCGAIALCRHCLPHPAPLQSSIDLASSAYLQTVVQPWAAASQLVRLLRLATDDLYCRRAHEHCPGG